MRFWFVLLLTLAFLVPGFAHAAPAAADSQPPVVRAVLFYSDLCNHCHTVMTRDLPPLQQKYGERLQIYNIEVTAPAARARMLSVAAALGLQADQVGVPLLVIGDRALLGADQIPAELPGLIEKHLAQGGVDYPRLPGLEDLTAMGESSVVTAPSSMPAPAPVTGLANGFALAIVIMVGMVATLLYVAVALTRGAPLPGRELANAVLPVLVVVGMGVAAYLTYIETTAASAICGPVGDCNAVQSSPYARFLGVPVGLIGLLGYVGILGAWLWQRVRGAELASLALFGMSLFGVVFSLYLTYLEPFVIGAVCAWCLSSAVLITLVFLLSAALLVPARPPEPILQEA